MKTEPQKEHLWLQKLVGEWTYESECVMEPAKRRRSSRDPKACVHWAISGCCARVAARCLAATWRPC